MVNGGGEGEGNFEKKIEKDGNKRGLGGKKTLGYQKSKEAIDSEEF